MESRSATLHATCRKALEASLERNARYAGRTEEVLAEGINPKDPTQLMGRTRTNRLTFFNAEGPNGELHRAGDLVSAHIDAVRSFSLSGTPLPTNTER